MRHLFALLGAGLFCVPSVGAAQPRDIDVRSSLSKTAVWVADRVTYTVTVACSKGVEILADDLSRDKLRVEGFEILGADSDRSTTPDETTVYTFRYFLTTYRVDMPELKIAPLTVRYFVKRAGQRVGDAAPAGEVQVPPAVVAFRSALPDGQENYAIRDGRTPQPRRLRYAWLQPIGVVLILLSIVPVGVVTLAMLRRTRPREKPRSARQVRHDEGELLEALQALDISTPSARRDAYSRVNALVRDHLRVAHGVDTAGLTAAEIGAALQQHEGRVPVELAAGLLGACDAARYAQLDATPSAEECRAAIDRAAQVVNG